MYLNYYSDIRKLPVIIRNNPTIERSRWGMSTIGTFRVLSLFGYPLFSCQHNLNFKVKYFVSTVPIVSLKRKPSHREVLIEQSPRKPRIYWSLGSLPFHDNGSGIPRVAKKLCEEGLAQSDIPFYPVYPDPLTGAYRIACGWCRERHLVIPCDDGLQDPEISVAPGDWLIQTMINPNANEFNAKYLRSFQEAGGYLGTILYDLIAEEHPEFFKTRDSVLFSEWLQSILHFDALFAISNSTQIAFESWCEKNHIYSHPMIGAFHLGANFSTSNSAQTNVVSEELQKRPFFLQVSTLEPRKGYDHLIDAFEELWHQSVDASLVIVGRRGWNVRKLINRIKQHPELHRRLFWFQNVTDDGLSALYRNTYGVVVASEAEGFGLPVVEGLHFGKPVIARDIPIFREIGGNSLIYFNGTEPHALANALMHVLTQPNHKSPIEPSFPTWKQSFGQLSKLVQDMSSQIDARKSL